MYAVVLNGEALIFDPHKSQELTNILFEKRVKKIIIILTHEHHDHTSGIYWYKERFDSTIICQKLGADYMSSRKYLRAMLLTFILSEEDKINGTQRLEEFNKEFVPQQYRADVTYGNEFSFTWNNHKLELTHIRGHSKGSSLIIIDDRFVFTGDSLLKDIPIITRFPGSSQIDYKQITLPILRKKLKNNMTIFPGHGNPFIFYELIKGGELYVQFR